MNHTEKVAHLKIEYFILNRGIAIFRQRYLHHGLSPHGLNDKPDVLVLIHGLVPGSFLHYQMPENISDGVNKCVHGLRCSATASCMLYLRSTG